MFSVLIPLYNKERYIGETINSVLNQSYKNFEIIVVNDGSTDNSLVIANSIVDDRIKIFSKANEGVSAARNYGINKSSGNYIAFLDADDLWEPDYLERMHEMIVKFPQAGLYCCAYRNITDLRVVNPVNNESNMFLLDDYFARSVKNGLSINITSATCVSRTLATSMPMFRNGIKRGEDIDVWLRIALNHPVAYCKIPLMNYRSDAANSLSSNYTKAEDEFPYEEWLSYVSESSYYMRYVVLVFYIFAKRAYFAKDYMTCYHALLSIFNKQVFYKGFKRTFLFCSSFVKK